MDDNNKEDIESNSECDKEDDITLKTLQEEYERQLSELRRELEENNKKHEAQIKEIVRGINCKTVPKSEEQILTEKAVKYVNQYR